MDTLISRHKEFWSDRQSAAAFTMSVIFLLASLVANFLTQNYATNRASNAVTDIFLDVLPSYNVNLIFVDGFLALLLFTTLLLLYQPKWIPFALKSIALFVLIRAGFTTLTHLGPPLPENLYTLYSTPVGVAQRMTSGGDYFFSGHTGIPFLFALMFWKNKKLRIIFLVSSVVFGTSALFGHLHYSIDVFAAFFITYSIFQLAKWAFNKDYKLFLSGDHLLDAGNK